MVEQHTPQYIRVISDLHLDFDAMAFSHVKYPIKDGRRLLEHEALWYPEPLPEDLDTVLVIPGDLWTDNHAFTRRFAAQTSWLERMALQFHSIVIVLGNHDYWRTSLGKAPRDAKTSIAKLGLLNVHLLENDTVCIGDVKYIGATLWTDYDTMNPLVVEAARANMNDFSRIRTSEYSLAKPTDIYKQFVASWKYIRSQAVRDYPEQKVVVVTHMAPSIKSINEMYRTRSNEYMNFSYYSELDGEVHDERFQADLWVHGHTHLPAKYQLDRTLVLCNPRGYESYEGTAYYPLARVNVDNFEVENWHREGSQDELDVVL